MTASPLTWPPCSDHGCAFGHPGGMGTNGGCHCLDELPHAERRTACVGLAAMRARAINKERARIVRDLELVADPLSRSRKSEKRARATVLLDVVEQIRAGLPKVLR